MLEALARSRTIAGPDVLDCIISEAQYAELLGVSSTTVRRRFRVGQGPPRIRLSERRYGFRLRDILADLDSHTEQPGSRAAPALLGEETLHKQARSAS
jgi:predicted DNA-binding transcriptional regulator AlpA